MGKRYKVYQSKFGYGGQVGSELKAEMDTLEDARQINLKGHDGRIVDSQTDETVYQRRFIWGDDGRTVFGWSGQGGFYGDYRTGPSGMLIGYRFIGGQWVFDDGDPLY